MNIKDELVVGLRELRAELGTTVFVKWNDDTEEEVPAIVNSINIQSLSGTTPIYKNELTFSILKRDLIDLGQPIRYFKSVTWDRKEYIVDQRPFSSWGEVIVLEGTIFG